MLKEKSSKTRFGADVIPNIIETPVEDADIITAWDKLLTALAEAKENAGYVESQIGKLMEMNRREQL